MVNFTTKKEGFPCKKVKNYEKLTGFGVHGDRQKKNEESVVIHRTDTFQLKKQFQKTSASAVHFQRCFSGREEGAREARKSLPPLLRLSLIIKNLLHASKYSRTA